MTDEHVREQSGPAEPALCGVASALSLASEVQSEMP